MIKVLTKEQEDVLAMCKPVAKEEDGKLMFAELSRDMFKDNEYILGKYFRNENGQECAYANLLAYKGIPGTTVYEIKKQLRKDFGKSVSLAGYRYDPEHYRFREAFMQDEYEEDLFKSQSMEGEEAEKEAERHARVEPLDFEALESLFSVFCKGLQARLMLILHLDDIPGIVNNAIDCHWKGVSCGPSNAAMHAKIAEVRSMLEDAEVIRWLKTRPTDLMFDRGDYVEAYQRALRQLTDIRDEPLEYCRDLIANEEDLWIDDIISNDYPDFESYSENGDSEDEPEEEE